MNTRALPWSCLLLAAVLVQASELRAQPAGDPAAPPLAPAESVQPSSDERVPGEGDARPSGVTKSGMPLDQRGMIGLDVAAFTPSGESSQGGQSGLGLRDTSVAIVVASRLQVAARGFVDVRLPLGIIDNRSFLGNITVGGHGVVKVGRRVWLMPGGRLGLPTYSSDSQRNGGEAILVGRTGWDADEFRADVVPLALSFGVEAHFAESGIFRADIAPILGLPLGEGNDGVFAIVQNSLEIQYGHELGVGLRLQGLAPVDGYQVAAEPFFTMERGAAFFRGGIMMPMNAPFGPPFSVSWGARIALGMRL